MTFKLLFRLRGTFNKVIIKSRLNNVIIIIKKNVSKNKRKFIIIKSMLSDHLTNEVTGK